MFLTQRGGAEPLVVTWAGGGFLERSVAVKERALLGEDQSGAIALGLELRCGDGGVFPTEKGRACPSGYKTGTSARAQPGTRVHC
jgi:hypothetical protein